MKQSVFHHLLLTPSPTSLIRLLLMTPSMNQCSYIYVLDMELHTVCIYIIISATILENAHMCSAAVHNTNLWHSQNFCIVYTLYYCVESVINYTLSKENKHSLPI